MVGSATPKFTGGLTTSLSWKNWSLGANVFFVVGNKVYNGSRNTIDADGSYIDYNMMSIHNGLGWVRWDPNDESTHLDDGSFLRLKHVTLAYNINTPILWNFVKGGRVYFTADNVLTLTKFSGADPEVRLEGTSWSLAGMFNQNYPVPRSFIFGIDLKF